jgi:hypothetical protein
MRDTISQQIALESELPLKRAAAVTDPMQAL